MALPESDNCDKHIIKLGLEQAQIACVSMHNGRIYDDILCCL